MAVRHDRDIEVRGQVRGARGRDRFGVVLLQQQLDVQFFLRVVQPFDAAHERRQHPRFAVQRDEQRVDRQLAVIERDYVFVADRDLERMRERAVDQVELVQREREVEAGAQREQHDERRDREQHE